MAACAAPFASTAAEGKISINGQLAKIRDFDVNRQEQAALFAVTEEVNLQVVHNFSKRNPT